MIGGERLGRTVLGISPREVMALSRKLFFGAPIIAPLKRMSKRLWANYVQVSGA